MYNYISSFDMNDIIFTFNEDIKHVWLITTIHISIYDDGLHCVPVCLWQAITHQVLNTIEG